MLNTIMAFSGFAVNDLAKAKDFYSHTLGLQCTEEGDMGLTLEITPQTSVFLYPKADHIPATFTVLNFVVEDIDQAVEQLKAFEIELEYYNNDHLPQDKKGVHRGLAIDGTPDIAWFKDPFGNILSVLQNK